MKGLFMNRALPKRGIIAAGLLLLTAGILTAAAPAPDSGKKHRLQVGAWLLLGPIEAPLPAFSEENPDFDAGGFLLSYDFLDMDGARPAPGSAVDLIEETSAWTESPADSQGITIPGAGTKPRVAYLAAYLESSRWISLDLEAEGSHPFEIFVDGESIMACRNPGGTKNAEAKLRAGKHLITVRTASTPADTASCWRFDLEIEAEEPCFVLSTTPEKPLSIEMILLSPEITSPRISPDGDLVAFKTRRFVPPEGKKEIWLEVRRMKDGGLVRAFESGSTEAGDPYNDLQWAPEGRRISYYDNEGTLLVHDMESGSVTKLLEKQENLGGYTWSPDGSYVVYSMTEKPEKDEKGVKRLLGIYDRTPYGRNRTSLYIVSGAATRRLTAGKHDSYLQAIHPSGHRLLISRRYEDLSKRPYGFTELVLMDPHAGTAEILYTGAWIRSAAWSPDGERILVLAGPSTFGDIGKNVPEGTIPNDYDTQVYIFDPGTMEVEAISRDFDPSIDRAFWSKRDGNIYLLAEEESFRRLFRFDTRRKRFERLDLGLEYIWNADVALDDLSAAVTAMGAAEPLRLYTVDLEKGRARMIFDPSERELDGAELGRVESWDFTSVDGGRIAGHVHYPPDFDPGKEYPCIVYYYGGTSPTGRVFGGRYPKNLWAAHGYIVYVIQPSGATGFGQAFSAHHVNDWGEIVSGEIMEGTKRFLEAHPFVDPGRVGCIGASFGGFMTQLLVTKTDLFSAAVSHAGISSITSYWGEGYWGALYNAVAAANSFPWNRPDIYVDRSPLNAADSITTPLLLLHGASDTNVPPGESEQMYTALKLLGREVEYIRFAGQSHFILDYRKRIAWSDAIIAWFDRWLKDEPEWWNEMYPPIDGATAERPGPVETQTFDLDDYGIVVMGEVTRDRILVDLPDWDDEFFEFEPDPAIIGEIANYMHDVEITVLLGTWCSDSRREIPRLWKILDEIGYPADEVTLYAVGSSRFTSEMPIPDELLEWSIRIKEQYGVERVATIIFYRGGEEIGRIVETPEATLEGDLLVIISK
jgi:dipeptidyl aminopeptidase/acylaminoacyl peptidase